MDACCSVNRHKFCSRPSKPSGGARSTGCDLPPSGGSEDPRPRLAMAGCFSCGGKRLKEEEVKLCIVYRCNRDVCT